MTEQTYWDVDVDVDELADELIAWFRRQGFETQDFGEGRHAVVVQARKAEWWRTVSGTALALTVRLIRQQNDLLVQVGATEWTDKAVGGALGLLVAWPFALTTGVGLIRQSQLPQEVLDWIETYLYGRRGRAAGGIGRRASSPSTPEAWEEGPPDLSDLDAAEAWLERERRELEEFEERLRRAREGKLEEEETGIERDEGTRRRASPGAARRPRGRRADDEWVVEAEPDEKSPPPPAQRRQYCLDCGAEVAPTDRFCAHCGARLEG